MEITSSSFSDGQAIPDVFAFAKPDPASHAVLSDNRNPELRWSGLPAGTKSLALICVDPDAPRVPDDVNKEGRTVSRDLPRGDFHHWVLIDLPPSVSCIEESECSAGVTPRGKQDASGPDGSRQGVNDYTSWFEGDADMEGTYLGYDGPAPPWNDERVHRYHFRLYALDFERCPVQERFRAADALAAIEGHVLGEAQITGTYTMNPALRG